MEHGIKDIIYLVALVATTVATFFGVRHGLKEIIRDKHEEQTNKIHKLELEMKDLKHKDELQQQVIEQIGKEINTVLPKLFDVLEKKGNGSKRAS